MDDAARQSVAPLRCGFRVCHTVRIGEVIAFKLPMSGRMVTAILQALQYCRTEHCG
jgi:hypothetical protein